MDILKNYTPLLEIGVVDDTNPAIKVLGDFELNPPMLAALCTGMFESTMRLIPESEQNNYEQIFLECFKTLMEERHNYDVIHKNLSQDE